MSSSTKPYRRFRARGRGDAGGIDELRRLTQSERAWANGRADEGRAARVAVPEPARPAPAPQPAPARPAEDRRRRRAMQRAGRPWWSFRALGPWGWFRRIALVLVVGVVVWAVAGFLALRSAVQESNGRVQAGVPGALAPPSAMLSSPTNILIVGSDARPGETRSRADTILVMRIDPDAGRIKYLSIPRDWRLPAGPLAGRKINESFAVAGQAGIVRNVRRVTGLPIHHLMVVNFQGFPRLVDELGGVTVTNPTRLVDCPYPGGRTVSFPRGRISLDGDDALIFARVRRCDDDFARAARQQALLTALKGEVLSPGSLWRAPWSGAAVVRALTTDMGVDELAKMAWLQARLEQDPADRIVLAGTPTTLGGISYVIGDPSQNLEQIRRFTAG